MNIFFTTTLKIQQNLGTKHYASGEWSFNVFENYQNVLSKQTKTKKLTFKKQQPE